MHRMEIQSMSTKLDPRLFVQFCLFVLGGGLSALLDLAVTAWALNFELQYQIAVSVGFLSGLAVNFLYHIKITFQTLMSPGSAVKFMTVVGINYAITMGIIWIVHVYLGMDVLLGKLISLPVIAINGFVLSRAWVFAKRTEHCDV